MRATAVNARRDTSDKADGISMRVLIILLASIFIMAGVEKWIDPADFEASLIRLELFPDGIISPIVVAIPFLEIVLGLMCLVISTSRRAIQGLLVLTMLYTLLLSYEWLRGIAVGCGCFGAQSGHWPRWALMLRNLGLLLLEVFLLRQASPPCPTAPDTETELRSGSQ